MVALSAVLVVVAGLAGVLLLGRGQDVLLGAPPIPPDAADAPLVLPPDVPDPGGYTFLTTGPGGEPARWDPCRPVHVVVRPQDEPDGGREAVTAALELAHAARARGLGLMTGCMISSSLSIAPALHVAALSDFADLDGPLWLAADRPGGVRDDDGVLHPPAAGFWGTVS